MLTKWREYRMANSIPDDFGDCAPEDIMVFIDHPWGESWVRLSTWMEQGPGQHRFLVRPTAAKCRITNEPLPLTVVPLRYRNTRWTRFLIRRGRLTCPWPDVPQQGPKTFSGFMVHSIFGL